METYLYINGKNDYRPTIPVHFHPNPNRFKGQLQIKSIKSQESIVNDNSATSKRNSRERKRKKEPKKEKDKPPIKSKKESNQRKNK